MKTKQIALRILVPVLLLMASFVAKAQLLTIQLTTTQGQCVPLADSNILFTPDTFAIVSAPSSGIVFLDTSRGVPGNLTYCPNGNFVGQDQFMVYLCDTISGSYVCNTYTFVVNVVSNCTLSVGLVQDSGICPGGNRSFTVVTNGLGTPPYTYSWSTGSTVASSCEPGPGQNECVRVTDANGCSGSACSGSGCNIYTTFVAGPCAGPLPSLQVIATGGTPPYTYYWGTGDSLDILCNLQPGTYCLSVFDANGCVGSGCYTISGTNGCSINYTVDSVTNNVSFNVNTDTTLTVASYAWSFGDSSTGSHATEVHSYPYIGSFQVYVSVYYTNGDSCWASTIVNVHDTTRSCTLYAYAYEDSLAGVCPNGGIPVIVSAYGGSGNYIYQWSNGSTSELTCGVLGGTYSVTITDLSSGCTAVTSYTIGGNYYYCQAYFYHYIDSLDINTFHFIDYSSYNPISWTWDFGDGTSSNLQNPVHTYAAAGTYVVCLTTADSSGCSSNYCETISNVPVQDLQAYLYHQTTVTPGFPVWVYLEYYNAGTISMNGTVTYRYPAGTTVNATSVVPTSHDVVNRLLTFTFSNLYPYSSDYIYVDLTASSSLTLGSMADDTLWVNPIAGDLTPADNVSTISDSVVGSWDPNDKAVSPKGEGAEGIVPMATNELSYRIRFQNTGTAAAVNVIVRDTLDNSIDLTTVQETNASHDHVTQLVGNVLTITFNNINLPDSGSNYAGSQGFIALHAKLKPSLTSGTRITNTAAIYFDFNAPVITNTVVTTLFDKTSGINSVQRFDFSLVPSPASSMVTLRGEFEAGSMYEVTNQLGQVLMTGEVKANSTNLNISKLSGGIYLVKVISGSKVGIQRLTVTR